MNTILFISRNITREGFTYRLMLETEKKAGRYGCGLYDYFVIPIDRETARDLIKQCKLKRYMQSRGTRWVKVVNVLPAK